MSDRPIRRVKDRLVHENPWWRVWDDDVEFSSGRLGRHLRLTPSNSKPGAVALVTCSTEAGTRVALVRQWRHAQNSRMWEFPRGFADISDSSSAATAAREAAEETASEVLSVRELGSVCPDSAIIELSVGVFHVEVRSLPAIGATAQDGEIDELRWVSFRELLALVADGEITDAFTLSALGLLLSQQHLVLLELQASNDEPTAAIKSPANALEP
jgi:8-oxo-dGTP pyrophosphatase MutT (NUDIX family)